MMFLLMVVICLLLGSFQAQSRAIEDIFGKSSEEIDNSTEQDVKSVSAIIERANKHAGEGLNQPSVMFGDIAVATGLEIADPCTARGCKWQRSKSGKVLVSYVISDEYSSQEKDVIFQGLRSFEESTCIRFMPRTNQRDYINIESNSGCFSFVGCRIGGQTVSLDRGGCISLNIVQHELLHTLGFHHEHNRSDHDNHVQILFKNIIPGQEDNFDKIKTKNPETAYDYSSVMPYGRFAFSKNREPTIIPIPDNNVSIGQAEKMSSNDILRINTLYCSMS
ncbi:LOW QUALITY PROTEIN: six-cysteine containing astacin protease 1 [Rhinichthys klamathensis goyatoka]|uniref:LOW QUALITY PROTEIN: six-cysteine containing astacin protease 1 n=1 Tax=Rhinichthys klamathensis goyatoka TaxID=3034132 RepID=UPI0024B4B8C5|nr:LOW QUALITY PROTEIN: six-cysteine containing astacin protease 1 [Rhinichthys klamathensis goyatoka]